jgi:uncharacterized membrane protein
MIYWLTKIGRLDAHHRLLIALGAAALSLPLTAGLIWPSRVVLTWVVYALIVLFLAWTAIGTLHPRDAINTYRIQDSNRWLIFVVVVLAAVASLGAVVMLLPYAKQMPHHNYWLYVWLSAVAILSSWWLVHTLFVLRYAHLYYGNGTRKPGGLNFPDTTEPTYMDFAYFAFGVGMTSQVADVGPTNGAVRQLIFWHALLSFGFNTTIIALTINVASGLL